MIKTFGSGPKIRGAEALEFESPDLDELVDAKLLRVELGKNFKNYSITNLGFHIATLLLDDELERRSQQRLAQRLKLSGCDEHKSLARFDFNATPSLNRAFIQELTTCAFINRHENLLLTGPTGVGKTHLANALAIEALKRDLRVLSRNTHRLLTDLHAARASGTHARTLTKLLSLDLLVLDDFGLQPLSSQATQDLYDLIRERYEHGSLIITSNRAFAEWAEVFGNDLLASAALDRLTHHCHTLVIQGESYRQRSRRKEVFSHYPASPADPVA